MRKRPASVPPTSRGTKSSAVGDNDGAVQSANLSQAIRIQRQPCQNRIAGQFGRPIPAHTAHKQERPSPLPCASRSSRHPRSQMRSASVLAAGPIRTIRLPPVVAAQRRGPPGGYSSYPAHQVRSRRLGRRTHGCRSSSAPSHARLLLVVCRRECRAQSCSLVRRPRSPPVQTWWGPFGARAPRYGDRLEMRPLLAGCSEASI